VKLKVEVVLLTHPEVETIVYHMHGYETIKELEDQVIADVKEQLNLTDPFIESRLEDNLVDVEQSLWSACEEHVEDFSPLYTTAHFVLTLDKQESFICGKPFDNTIMAAIGGCTVFMCLEHYNYIYDTDPTGKGPYNIGTSDGFVMAQIVAEWFFNVIFIIEMCCKLVCLKGFCNYIGPPANKLDFVIVMSSILQIIMDFALADSGVDLSILKLFRLFRVLRVTRLLRKFKSVRELLDAAFGSIKPILNIMMFMLLILIVFCCLGMQLYGAKFAFDNDSEKPCECNVQQLFDETCEADCEVPRTSFDSFLTAFYTLFQVLSGSAWEGIMFDCMRAPEFGGIFGCIYVMFFFVLSNYIILNLFIGAILANMGTDTDDDRLNETNRMKNDKIAAQKRARSPRSSRTASSKSGRKGAVRVTSRPWKKSWLSTSLARPSRGKFYRMETSKGLPLSSVAAVQLITSHCGFSIHTTPSGVRCTLW
jgi:hypothetical protein